MFDPNRWLIEEIARAIDTMAPAKLRTAEELTQWARRRYEQSYLLVDDEGRRMPLSPEQTARGAAVAAEFRGKA